MQALEVCRARSCCAHLAGEVNSAAVDEEGGRVQIGFQRTQQAAVAVRQRARRCRRAGGVCAAGRGERRWRAAQVHMLPKAQGLPSRPPPLNTHRSSQTAQTPAPRGSPPSPPAPRAAGREGVQAWEGAAALAARRLAGAAAPCSLAARHSCRPSHLAVWEEDGPLELAGRRAGAPLVRVAAPGVLHAQAAAGVRHRQAEHQGGHKAGGAAGVPVRIEEAAWMGQGR